MAFVQAGGHKIEFERFGPQTGPERPVVVMLHEGLGSVAMWRDFPAAVAERTGLPVVAYSRWGYGKSDPIKQFPHGTDYMHREAQVDLRDLLRTLDIRRPILFGHSDGASIALIYAGSGIEPAPLGVAVMAPHVFVEKVTTLSIAKARVAYEETDLRQKLARYHADVDSAFFGWNVTWLLPQFAAWNIEALVPKIACPILVIQGADDEYGTPKQLESIKSHSGGRAELVLLPACGHSPHRDQREATLNAFGRFAEKLTSQKASAA
ncbi:MAG: alpha/beta fold hydrolase [Alphaproteobacteria bacterium]